MEKYSVLMSLYKDEKPQNLKVSIQSMLDQTVKPDEIVLVKDGPITEALETVVSEFVQRFPDLFIIVPLEKNIGLGLALNEGLKHCQNELVARMDTDDLSLSDRCEKQLKAFQIEELDIVGTNIDEFIDDPANIVSSRSLPSEHDEIVRFSRRRNPFNHPTVMYRKSAVLANNGYSDYRRNQDMDLFIRMLNNGCRAKNINESLLLFRANEDNLKRRKSWTKASSNIVMLYDFWKKGYSGFGDFLIASMSHLAAFLMPNFIFEKLSKKYLRKSKEDEA
ncbi:glycosyltransferase [Alkalibacterium sp. 20]|uniref:glycosyltransferase n=1 Tax=Alkalibacterium sp. 20 TaxID=1798803 RepID=UPI0008FFF40A|nr:glycosyltransferase [Alkalibacterium sp. 20]OJF90674.1 glycosyl transferase [Alkalibacterium sp. 20]